ncbi:MAG: DASS family sodium-coupled anion symporter [Bacteroidetes bacterium]|nr:DASS family sodium-coupled anion symporter [Bacteroidota bacterium]
MLVGKTGWLKKLGLITGPVASLLLLVFYDLAPENPLVTYTASVALLMAVWWITEAVPLAVTALIPVALFPLFGIMNGKEVSSLYFNHVIFLFLGGFMVALAMQKWNLHKRIALVTLMIFGVKPRRILLGFMISTAFLSMWISNTATAMMMLPIALSVIISLEEILGQNVVRKYSIGLFLGIAYSASIGGIATLVGTPPNPIFTQILVITFPGAPEISFSKWFFFALPISIIFLFITWSVLSLFFCKVKFRLSREVFSQQYKQLGKMLYEEKVVLAVFIFLALLWLTRSDLKIGEFTLPGWSGIFPYPKYINDGTVAISFALLLFIIPAKRKPRIMNWETTKQLPWGIVLLFGGGFALAGGFKESGLSEWFGNQLIGLGEFSPTFLIGSICFMITFLTELTSNTATVEMVLPILASLSIAIVKNPLLLMVPATLASSFAFMMPVATPPNAIIFGTGRIRIIDMVKAGFFLNLIGVLILTIGILILGFLLEIDPGQMPDWAK